MPDGYLWFTEETLGGVGRITPAPVITEFTDRCDGTLTRVTRGAVAVRDFRRHRTVVVRARHSYPARARR